MGGAATPEGVFCCTHNPCQSRSSGQCSGYALCQQRAWQGQEVKQAVARLGNHTCVELTSALSTRTRFGPFSSAMSTSASSTRRSCRGAIVDLHAPAGGFFFRREHTEEKWPRRGPASQCPKNNLR
eukprot:scaffold15638_cov119-Isochrysis_galbana.AAC.1